MIAAVRKDGTGRSHSWTQRAILFGVVLAALVVTDQWWLSSHPEWPRLLTLLAVAIVVRFATGVVLWWLQRRSLNPEERALVQKLGFDESVARRLKATTLNPIRQLEGRSNTDTPIPLPGLETTEEPSLAEDVIDELQPAFLKQGYFLFLTKQKIVSFDDEPSQIGLLKATDLYEVLRTMETNGVNDGFETDDVIKRLKHWSTLCEFQLIGAGYDWFQIKFVTTPQDRHTFAKDVVEFCPTYLGLGGSEAEILESIAPGEPLVIWWD